MTERFKPSYVLLTSDQVEKLPWNRLKNIMNSVRAVISSIEHYHGTISDGGCDCRLCSKRKTLDYSIYNSEQERDTAIENILKPHKEYFHMLKSYAHKLPHTDSVKSPKNRKIK